MFPLRNMGSIPDCRTENPTCHSMWPEKKNNNRNLVRICTYTIKKKKNCRVTKITVNDFIRVSAGLHHPFYQVFASMSSPLAGFSGSSVVKNLPANAGDAGLIPGSGRSSGGGNGNPLQYSCLENSMDREAWQSTVCGVTKSWTWLSN